jgi:hypothetical protein
MLVVNITCSACLRPIAYLWFGLAEILGFIVSRIILTLVFFLLIVPIGFVRYCYGADPMRFKEWKSPHKTKMYHKNGNTEYDDSVFIERNHLYVPDDIFSPF